MKIIDMHCDTILGLLEKEQKYQDVSLYANDLCVDIQKLKAGDYLIQYFTLPAYRSKTVLQYFSKNSINSREYHPLYFKVRFKGIS